MNTALHPNIQQGMNNFHSNKPKDDMDLVAQVREILAGFTPEAQLVQNYDNNRFIIEAQGKISDVQKFLLNRYWFFQFSACPDNMSARLGLLPDGDVYNWLQIFRMSCIAFIQKNNLPKAIDQVA